MVSRHPPDSGKRPNPHHTVMVEKLSAAHLSATTEEWIEAYSEIVKNEGYEPCGKTGRCQLAGRKFQSAVFVVDRELKTFERTTLMASKMRVCNDNHSFPALHRHLTTKSRALLANGTTK